ncbi:MAG: hypothetical protein QOI99_419 [Actinomycetota bacterium]|nr:hypothetical protein [Actinomycetota bacterium]
MSPKSKVRKKPPKHRELSPRARQAALEASRKATRRKWSVATVVLIVVLVFGISQVVGRGGGKSTEVETGSSTTLATNGQRPPVSVPAPALGASITGDTPCPPADGSSPRTTHFAKAPPTCIDAAKGYVAEMQTSKGLVTVALDPAAAPITVNNFVVLARYHYFDTLPFHRIVKGFVIQGGSPDASGNGNPGYQFADEVPAAGAYQVGSLAMANSGPNTNGSQFFIVTGAPATLQPLYSLFGQVTGGADVLQAIDAAGTPATDANSGKPTEVVTVQTVTIKEI